MKRLLGLTALFLLLLSPALSWSRGGGGCLEEGTPIRTPKGSVAIEKLAVGDPVWSITAGQLREAKVRAVIRVDPEEVLEISAGETRLRVTPEHPLLVAPGDVSPGWFPFSRRNGFPVQERSAKGRGGPVHSTPTGETPGL